MLRVTPLASDDPLRAQVRARSVTAFLTTLLALKREAADRALSRGDLASAAALEETSALVGHRLGQLEDAMLDIVRDCRPGTRPIRSARCRPRDAR